MTFEEYKKDFEVFRKVDTPEILALCEKQYQKYILNHEDENYFEPLEARIGNDIVSTYNQSLNNIFKLDRISANEFYFMIVPSFQPESLLVTQRLNNKYFISHFELTVNHWSTICAGKGFDEITQNIKKAELNKQLCDRIFSLLDETIANSRPKRGNGFTLDGTDYILSKIIHGERTVVHKHSPDDTTRPGKIINILKQLTEYVDDLNETLLLKSLDSIDGLDTVNNSI